jgi:acyl-CoA thioester hydrolase
MKRYNKTIKVGQADLDELQHVNNVRYVQWIQDISREHWLNVAPPDLAEKALWVVRKHEIEYKEAAILGDMIEISTYIEATKGPLSYRVVEMMLAETRTLLLRSRTAWCLLDSETQQPVRIPQEIDKLFSGKEG